MIYELKEKHYEKVRPMFKGLDYNLIVNAVIEGTSPGRIYVNDVINPKTVFMCSVEGYYLAGYEGNAAFNIALNKLITETSFQGDTVREGEEEISLRFHPDTWEAKLKVIFKGRSPLKAVRRHYVCSELKIDWKDQIPDGFSIKRVDQKLLERPSLRIPDHMTNWMKTNWGSIDDFMRKGFGFCMLHGNEVVCWCIADCVSGNACEIGIHTRPDYRRRGLATLTVAATVDYCLSHGFASVGWHCDEDNLGSIGVAEKVGFEKERDYVHYFYMFDEAHHLAETGLAHLRARKYREAAECYEKVFAMGDVPRWMNEWMHVYYHLAARAWAALGESPTAIKYLNTAIDKGWTDIELTKNCEEFTSLHGTEGWKELLVKLQGKMNASK